MLKFNHFSLRCKEKAFTVKVIRVTQRGCRVSILEDTQTPTEHSPEQSLELGMHWAGAGAGELQRGLPVSILLWSCEFYTKCKQWTECFNLFSEGWKQQAKASDLNEDTSTAQHHLAEANQDGYPVLSVAVQSLQWGILEMAGSLNLGDGARKGNAGATCYPPRRVGKCGSFILQL